MYCVYMSADHLEEEPAEELYGDFIDENYKWRPGAAEEAVTDDGPDFLNDDSDTDVNLRTGEGSDQ